MPRLPLSHTSQPTPGFRRPRAKPGTGDPRAHDYTWASCQYCADDVRVPAAVERVTCARCVQRILNKGTATHA